jgi:hypothetical protein
MKLKNIVSKLILSTCIITACSSLCLAQNTNAVRYQITPDIMLRLIEEYPEKKEKIQTRIQTEYPHYIDMYVDSNRVIEVVRFANDSVGIVRIFQLDKSTLLAIYTDSKSEKGSIIEYEEAPINFIEKVAEAKDTLKNCAYVEVNNSFPITACFIKDSLNLRRSLNINGAAYPEHQVISKSNQFPIKIVHGNPKVFMTYDFLQTIEYPTELRLAIDAIIKIPKSKSSKKVLFDLLST